MSLCGHNAVQIHERARPLELRDLAARLAPLGAVRANEFALRFEAPPYLLTVFPDGRAIIKGTTDVGVARSLYARYIGALRGTTMRRILPVLVLVASCLRFLCFAAGGGHGGGGEACAGAVRGARRWWWGSRWLAAEVSEAGADFAAGRIPRRRIPQGGFRRVSRTASAATITRVSTATTIRSGGTTGWDYGDYGYGYHQDHYVDAESGLRLWKPESDPRIGHFQSTPPQPPVIVQPPPAPAVWERRTPQRPGQKYEDTLFLLAMKDGTIRAVLAYWVEGATVHYVTMDHEQKQTPLASLDRGSQRAVESRAQCDVPLARISVLD